MTVFVPESIKVLGSDAGGASVVLCDMFVDDLADLPAHDAYTGYKLSMGCTATVINDNSRHRLNSAGQWVQITAGTATYTKAEIDSMIARIDATEAEDRAALIALVDGGAKNLLSVNGGSGTNVTILSQSGIIKSGNYVMTFKASDFSGNYALSFYDDNGALISLGSLNGAITADKVVSFKLGQDAYTVKFFIRGTATISKLMLCTAADYAISTAFVPYAPTNRELYDMIQSYHP